MKYQASSDSDDAEESDEKEIKIPKQFKSLVTKYQDLLLKENNDWKVINYVDKVQISGLDLVWEDVQTTYKPLKGVLLKILIILGIVQIIKTFIYDLPIFIPAIVSGYLLFKASKNF